ncbi:MAG TPA: hypothetical protein VKH81_04815 [Candidatus Angelobacter sp.]|nr:hypothetical protein [Candidatus Angelobacter sp.]
MSRTKFFLLVRLAMVAIACAALGGCNSSSNSQPVEKSIAAPAPQASAAPTAKPVAKLPPPTRAEIEAAFHRVFGNDLIANASNRQSYIVGDFNGDESEDLAIIVRPAPGKLADVNSELSNWTIQDADHAFIAAPGKTMVVAPHQERPHIESGEEVLAIIHGYGPQGWRNPEARQAYLVKHAAATLLGTAPSLSQKAIRVMKLPYETDIIKQVRNNRKGFLFWTGGVYAWHPSEG